MTIPCIRRCFGVWFLLSHRCVAIGGIGTTLWHVLGTSSAVAKLVVALSCSFWIITTLIRLVKMVYYRHTAKITDITYASGACHLSVRLDHEVSIYPGCYFHIFFPLHWFPLRWMKFNFSRSSTAMAFWYQSDKGNRTVTNITFLLSSRTRSVCSALQLQLGQSVFLDGPYGRDLALQNHENVILAAKGIGIACTLPLALDLAIRRRHDNRIRDRMQTINEEQQQLYENQQSSKGKVRERIIAKRRELSQEREILLKQRLYRDAVKKVDVFWSLDCNEQIEWASSQLRYLQALDPDNVSSSPDQNLED